MIANARRSPIQPGEPAPEFDLPAASGSGTVSLADYRGKNPVSKRRSWPGRGRSNLSAGGAWASGK
jgi:hypothetical protein